jgi:chromosome segregation ATPase
MPSLTAISLDQALLIGRAVFLVFCFLIAALAFTRWRKASEHTTDLFFEQNNTLLKRLSAMEEQLAATQSQLAEARTEITTIATRTQSLAERLEDSEQRRTSAPAATTAPSYQIAIRLAKSGAPREEIMSSCGLSRQEAELVQRLHGSQRKLAAAS